MAHPHKSKRHIPSRDQAQITSFFTSSSTVPDSVSSLHASLAPPAPPCQVQSSLLNVGMRIRKSVPEGYKTGKLSPASPLSPQSSNIRNGNTSLNSYFTRMPGTRFEDDADSDENGNAMSSGPMELMPFCGLHKTGGLVAPPQPTYGRGYVSGYARGVDAYGTFHAANEDPFKSLNSSQESNASTESSTGRKRVLGGMGHYFAGEGSEDEDEAEGRDILMGMAGKERKFAVPRGTRGRRTISAAPPSFAAASQPAQVEVLDDFADADFLRPRDDAMEL